MADYLDQLSEFVADTRFTDLGPEVIAATKDVVLDTAGAIVAGSRLPENIALAALVAQRSGPATATLLGHGLKAEPMLATLINSTAGVALEVDEGTRFGGGHPAIHVLPGALAVAEEMGADGQRLIEGILVGYEVESRLGRATTPRPNVHSHGHWGTMGTAAAVAKLRGYNRAQVRTIINLAASMSPANAWSPCFEGATIRNLYPGRSGFQGILAVHLYECGFTGLSDGPADVFGTILGEHFDPEVAIQDLSDGFRIQQNYFKFHACCRFNHPALDAVMALRHRESLGVERIEDIEDVEVVTIDCPEGMVGGYPHNMLGARFSIPYAVAAAIVLGATDLSAFSPEAIGDGRIRKLTEKVRVMLDPHMSLQREGQPTARVSVLMKGGRRFSETTYVVRGEAANPVPRQELVGKFLSLTDEALGLQGAQATVEVVDRLEDLSTVAELTAMLGDSSLANEPDPLTRP